MIFEFDFIAIIAIVPHDDKAISDSPAFIEAGEALASAGGSVTGTLEAQASFATILF